MNAMRREEKEDQDNVGITKIRLRIRLRVKITLSRRDQWRNFNQKLDLDGYSTNKKQTLIIIEFIILTIKLWK